MCMRLWAEANFLNIDNAFDDPKNIFPWNSPNYHTRPAANEDPQNRHLVHTTNFMTKHANGNDWETMPVYGVENSLYLKAVGGQNANGRPIHCLEGVKVFCDEGHDNRWRPHSYSNEVHDDTISVKYPTSAHRNCLRLEVDTLINHVNAVETTRVKGWIVPLVVLVKKNDGACRFVYAKTRVQSSTDGLAAPSYTLKLCRK